MDFTHESNIIDGTLKKLKYNLSMEEGPSTEQILQQTEQKVTYMVNLHIKPTKSTTYGIHICT